MAHMGIDALSASELISAPKRLLAGEVIGGKYWVSHLLGEGGMAAVWAGINQRTGKHVALKVIRSDFMATPGAEAFLHSEGLATSRVNHPNVVSVFDVIEHEGVACIVMELLDGLPLGTYISCNGQLSLRDAFSLLLPAMRGVAAAHAQGVIHRDLKPQNIFVCIDPDGRVVTTKVLDFGISVMIDWARERVAAMPGLVGTPAYMAPEYIEGSDKLDERVDVYGFGVLLYEALTARAPFSGEPGTELLHRVMTESAVPLRELRPDLPPAIVHIIETAMAKRPDQRFASLNQMVLAIEDQIMSATPPLSGTPSSGVPVTALSYTVSGPLSLAVPTHIGKEPSGRHCETQIFFGQPTKRGTEEAPPDSEMVGNWNRKLAAVDASRLPLNPSTGTSAVPSEASGNYPSTEVRPRGASAILHRLRDWRLLAGAGIALVIVISILAAKSTDSRAKTGAPSPSAPAALPASPPSTPPPAVVRVDPLPPSPTAALEVGEPSSVTLPPGGQDLGGRASGIGAAGTRGPAAYGEALAPRPATRSPRGAKRETPRAGALSVDDF
jgi:serine/threonine protein kinase